MKKFMSILLAAVLMLSLLAGCAQEAAEETKKVDPNAVLSHLLSDITYDAPLVNTNDLASIYFSAVPEGTAIQFYKDETNYHADRVAMLTAPDADYKEAVEEAIQKHLTELRTEFQNYIPEELPKIDNAIIWSTGKTVFLIIAPDKDAVNRLLKDADSLKAEPAGTTPSNPGTSDADTTPDTEPTTEPSTTAPVTGQPNTDPSQYPVLTSPSGTYSIYSSGVMKVDNTTFEQSGYDPGTAATYAKKVSAAATQLKGITNVYSMPIPTAIGVVLPDNIRTIYPNYRDQSQTISSILGNMSQDVITVNCHHNMMLHRDEYLYFRTDFHWNGPGGYYAYESFCNVKGVAPYTMEQRQEIRFDNFLGAMYQNYSGLDPQLAATPDTVIAYKPYHPNVTMFFRDNNGNQYDWPIINDVSGWSAGGKYMCFAAGDQPYAEFHNPNLTDGSALVIVKESFGNVLLSYLVDHYSVVYEIDYRYWQGDLVSFCKEVGATDLLFANNITAISSGGAVGNIARIVPYN